MHSHLGVDSMPELKGSDDTNSLKGIAQPWLRSLDGLNTHDEAYRLSVSGGVATALVLPGSADAIGLYMIDTRCEQSNRSDRRSSLHNQIEAYKGAFWIVNVARIALQYGDNAQGYLFSSKVATNEVRAQLVILCKHNLIYYLRLDTRVVRVLD